MMEHYEKVDIAKSIMCVFGAVVAFIAFILLLIYLPLLMLASLALVVVGSIVWAAYTLWKDYRSGR